MSDANDTVSSTGPGRFTGYGKNTRVKHRTNTAPDGRKCFHAARSLQSTTAFQRESSYHRFWLARAISIAEMHAEQYVLEARIGIGQDLFGETRNSSPVC